MKAILIIIAALIFGTCNIFSQQEGLPTDSIYVADLLKLQKLLGLEENAQDIKGYVVNRFRTMAPDAGDVFWDSLSTHLDARELIYMNAVSFATVFTHADVKELIKFYESPVGLRLNSNLEGLNQSMNYNEGLWAESIRIIILKALQDSGHLEYNQLEPEEIDD